MSWLREKSLHAAIGKQLIGEIDRNDLTAKFTVLIRVYILIICIHRLILGASLMIFRQWTPGVIALIFSGLNYLFYKMSNEDNRKIMKNLYTAMALLWIVMTVYLLGWNIGAQHFLFSLMVFWVVTGDESLWAKMSVGIGFCAIRLLLYLYIQDHAPIYVLDPGVTNGEQFVNTIFIFLSVLFLTTVFCRETILAEEEHSRQELQRAFQQAENANRAKTTFLSSMSHDIRTPLNAIVGIISLARRRTTDAAYMDDALDSIGKASDQLLTLINDILDISKIESGEVTLNEEPFSVSEFVNRMVSIITPSVKEKGHNLKVDIHDIIHDRLNGDRLRLSQIYMNLLSNAVKYTDSGGQIYSEVYEETISDKPDQVRLVLTVKDNGVGISEAFQKRMYTAFSRETDTRTNKIQGSGLGLAICKQLVELMGGSIDCHSVEEKGTTFTLKIDLSALADVQSDGTMVEETDAMSLRGLHLLVVEDNTVNWRIIRDLLEDEGITAERAMNGQECLETLARAEAHQFDAILMDVEMPVMNGIEATHHIRESQTEWIRTIPIFAVTANAFAEDVRACLQAGMDDHISKPVDVAIVIQKLSRFKN